MKPLIGRRMRRFQHETLEIRTLLASDLVISEIMARNSSTLMDDDGDFSDWIEIYNPGPDDANLLGWHLSNNVNNLDQWSFPNRILPAGNFMTVFASGKDRISETQPLHTNFRISASGEYVALAQEDANNSGEFTVASQFDVPFPVRATDASYGIGHSVEVAQLVSSAHVAKYFVPTDDSLAKSWVEPGFDDSSWESGFNAIGYEATVPGFQIDVTYSDSEIRSLADADSLLRESNDSGRTSVVSPVVNFLEHGGGSGAGNFGDAKAFPDEPTENDDDFAVRAHGTVIIPTAGIWSFGTNNDDGIRLQIDGVDVIHAESIDAAQNNIGQIELSEGRHEIDLVYVEREGGAAVELFAARGSFPLFNADVFQLVGDTLHGGLRVETPNTGSLEVLTGFSEIIETDLRESMWERSSSVYVRIPFLSQAASSFADLTLRVRYDDGYVAYLNGTEVARRNAPEPPQFDSVALSNRFDEDAQRVEDIDISQHLNLINRNAFNLLAIHGINDSIDSDEFLISAELAELTVNDGDAAYFTTPTPGEYNLEDGLEGFLTDEIQFDHHHGYYDDPFSLEVSAATAGTNIRYTLDGSEPTETNGIEYQTPILIDRTTTVRARAFKTGFDPSKTRTATYIFTEDVIRQSADGTAPEFFPVEQTVNGQILDYGLDPEIVNSEVWGPQLDAALKQVPSISIAMNIDDLLGETNGIYTNAQNHGRSWERAVSLELIHPDGSPGFSENAGLRIRGGASRSNDNPKHAFRLFFRDVYGNGKLNYPLFGSEGAAEFDKIDLRTPQNYSWAFAGSEKNTFVRDVFSRDLQGLMGHEYSRSRYYHLYLNGQYWGLYQTQERTEARFAASYMGGDPADFDVVKSNGSSSGSENEATDGNLDAYERLFRYFKQPGGLGDVNVIDYWKAQGLNLDGSRNPAYERLLDVDNLIDYMVITYYTSDVDGPGSKFARPRINNYFAIYNRANPDGFKFFEHDSEHSLDTGNAAGADFNMVTPLTTGGSNFRYFNPHWMHEQLANSNSDYRQRFADRIHELFFNDGLLTSENATALVDTRASQIELAMIAESARWGDAQTATPFTQHDWQEAVTSIRDFIEGRIPVVLDQLKGQSWYPDTNPPAFSVNGAPQESGHISTSDQIAITLSTSTSFSPLIHDLSPWKYLDDGTDPGETWTQLDFNESSWATGNAELGFGDGDEQTTIGFGSNANDKHPTTYFRKSFNLVDPSRFESLRLRLKRDDGAIAYLNGIEVVRTNMPDGTIGHTDFAVSHIDDGDEQTFFEFQVDPNLLVQGENLLAVEVHQASPDSDDLSFDLELLGAEQIPSNGTIFYTTDGTDPRAVGGAISDSAKRFDVTPFTLSTSTAIRARVLEGNQWSVLSTATFLIDVAANADNLAITEVNYNPHDPLTQFGESNVDNDQFEFIELENLSSDRIDLTGVRFVEAPNGDSTEGIVFQFATETLDPGQTIVVARNRAAFTSRYGDSIRLAERLDAVPGTGVFDGGLSNNGELLTLLDADGEIIRQFEYNDAGGWSGRADGNGATLEIVSVQGNYSAPSNWQASDEIGGTPGFDGSGRADTIVINEILTHTDLPQIDALELYNTTDSPIEIAGWYISDNNDNYLKYRIPLDTPPIPAGGYRVFEENVLGFGFKGQESDDAWLVEADNTGKPIRFADQAEFNAAQNGVSFGRWPNAIGRLFPMTELTLGLENSGPVRSDVVISEIQFHASAPPAGSPITENELEFIEIWNSSSSPVDIGSWRIDNAVDFVFPPRFTMAADERVTLVSFDPFAVSAKTRAFRDIYNMENSTLFFGPYRGQLDNGGENVQLERPEDLQQIGLGYVLIDEVRYDNEAPWPSDVDGQGLTLNRVSPHDFGNFASSWFVADPSPGIAGNVRSLSGDFNDDQIIDVDDVNLLCMEMRGNNHSSDFDLNQDGFVDSADRKVLIEDILGTDYGDANLDGIVNSTDLIVVFSRGQYEDDITNNSLWTDGDWNCDGEFGTSDLIVAFTSGAYVTTAAPTEAVASALVLDQEAKQPTARMKNANDSQKIASPRQKLLDPIALDLVIDSLFTPQRERKLSEDDGPLESAWAEDASQDE